MSGVPQPMPSPVPSPVPSMTRSWRSKCARAMERLLHLHDTPERTAAAVALGVFFSFSPFIGLQIVLSMSLAFLFRLNRLAVFVGLNANLPWFLVPWYAGTTFVAARLLGGAPPDELWNQVANLVTSAWTTGAFIDRARVLVANAFVPLMVGPTVGAFVVSVASYPLVRRVLVTYAGRASSGPPVA